MPSSGDKAFAEGIMRSLSWRRVAAVVVFGATLAIRVQGVGDRFWMLEDQIRDWSVVLGSLADLPLIGSPTHFGGYTIGPAFYWILWGVRVTVGPWFDNFPHAGGIGQAIIQSGADALLLVAIWRRTASPWIALAAVILIATASYDVALAALVWNPTMGAALAKVATALVLLDWHRQGVARMGVSVVVAWCAVHAYTGTIFVAVGVFVAILLDPVSRRDWSSSMRAAGIIAAVVACLQLPYFVHRVSGSFSAGAMGGVFGSVERILSGQAEPAFMNSVDSYVRAVHFIGVEPWQLPGIGWLLVGCGVMLVVRYRRDLSLLSVILVPQGAALVGYGFFLADLNDYYYLSLMPAANLMCVLSLTALTTRSLAGKAAVVVFVAAICLVPVRLQHAGGIHQMPEYRLLVKGSNQIWRTRESVRSIATEFSLHPTTDPEFLYTILGGRIDQGDEWGATIMSDGGVVYRNYGGP